MIVVTNHEGGVGISETVTALQAGRVALDAAEAGVRLVEIDPEIRSVGFIHGPTSWGRLNSMRPSWMERPSVPGP